MIRKLKPVVSMPGDGYKPARCEFCDLVLTGETWRKVVMDDWKARAMHDECAGKVMARKDFTEHVGDKK